MNLSSASGIPNVNESSKRPEARIIPTMSSTDSGVGSSAADYCSGNLSA
ncbi:MAG: hypothetical protein P4K80_08160 [Acidobacteriaceae bacterium]|nr:hypothetical protein [Acidobacteriaceae bacterium]